MHFSLPRVTPRTAKLTAWLAIPAALAVSGIAVSNASYAAFSATTSNAASNWSAGSVALTDDDANAALFTVTGLKPGLTGANCIAVTSTGSLPSAVKLYATNTATTNALSSYLSVSIEQGTGGGFGSCTGFTPLATTPSLFAGTLAALGTANTGYATGLGSWTPTGTAPETRVYRITYSLAASTPNSAQGGTASLGLTWEAQNS
ncbi:hypothetical protein EDF46_3597 [Frondihabitans sp. PhB188]|nr:hypothetical protein EDF46_3597 [Frondihabitans sp. PhB188]